MRKKIMKALAVLMAICMMTILMPQSNLSVKAASGTEADANIAEADNQVTLTSINKVNYRSDGCWVVYLNYTGTFPSDQSYYNINLLIDGNVHKQEFWYASEGVCFVGLWTHPNSYVTFPAGILEASASGAPSLAITQDYSISCIDDTITPYVPAVSDWATIGASQAFGDVPKAMTGNITGALTTVDKTELKFNGAFLADVESTEAKVFVGTNSGGWNGGYCVRWVRTDNTIEVRDYMTDSSGARATNLLTGSKSILLTDISADYADTTSLGYAFRTQVVDNDVYAFVYIEGKLQGMYCFTGVASALGNYIFAYSGGTGGSFEVNTYVNNLYDDVTIAKLASASGLNGSTWTFYPVPESSADVPGEPWVTQFVDVAYEVDGALYTTNIKRANDSEGLYMTVAGTILDPATPGSTVTIKAGKYLSDDGSNGINITEDFTIYVMNGSLSTEFTPDAPDLTSDVYCNTDLGVYTITEAEEVTIDGETYYNGDNYSTIGTHILSYTLYGYDYTRKLVIYCYGDVSDDGTVALKDLIRIKKYISEEIVFSLTDSEEMGADLTCNGEINEIDTGLLREYLILGNGVLVLSPEIGQTVALPSNEVAAMETNYVEGMAEELRTGDDLYFRTPIKINWISQGAATEYQIFVSTKNDMSDALTYTTTDTTLEINNLLTDTTYYWQLAADDYTSQVRTFHTADTIRTLTIEGVSNTRDAGGYEAANGKTVKYGMIYRGGRMNYMTEAGKEQMLEVLGIKTDLDLRTPGEGGAGETKPLGDSVQYLNYDAPYYWTMLTNASYKDALTNEIKAFANPDNYPIYVHCSVGRDRTGTIILLINGLLGVSREDLALDYELSYISEISGLSNPVSSMMQQYNAMYEGIQSYAPEGTFAEACEAFMKEYCGITQEEIDSIRAILVE